MPEDFPPATIESAPQERTPASKAELRGKKKRFADAFRLNFNITEAAKAAGAPFGKEREFGTRMLDDPAVSNYLAVQAGDQVGVPRPSQVRVLDEMAAIAFSEPEVDFHTEGPKEGQVKRVRLDKMDRRAIQQFTLRQRKDGDSDLTVKFHPKAEMLKTLAQVNGLLADDGAPAPRVSIFIGGGQVQINSGGGK